MIGTRPSTMQIVATQCDTASDVRRFGSDRITLLLAAIAIGALGAASIDEDGWRMLLLSGGWVTLWFWTLTAVGSGCLALRWLLWLRYRPWQPISDRQCPTVSVVLPAFNEGGAICHTIASVLASRYPTDRLELIIIDDGSTDDTAEWIIESCGSNNSSEEIGSPESSDTSVVFIRLPVNQGKRAALAAGFARARGKVIVTIDSDCIADADAIRHLVSPIVRDPNIAGVAGQICVLASQRQFLPWMLVPAFAVSFDWCRAAQSSLGSVLCLPGAASALRASALRPLIPVWQSDTFIGRPCRTAEDRALTTLLLCRGWRTVYQTRARVQTRAPACLRDLWRTYLRWTRGDIRESLSLERSLLWSNLGIARRWAVTLVNIAAALELALPYLFLFSAIPVVAISPYLCGSLCVGLLIGSAAPMTWCILTRHPRITFVGLLYGGFWLLLCSWIPLWSALTLRDNRWLTR